MTVKYICRHCRTLQGELNGDELSEFQLGFHFLTPEERRDIIAYNADGETTVHVICEYCREALECHPELALLPNPLQ